jgi:hypothetical protein
MNKKFEDEFLGVFAPNHEFDRKRAEANVELIQLLAQYLTDHPSERFGQALCNLDIIRQIQTPGYPPLWNNEFNTEPVDTLKRVKDRLWALRHG